MRIALDDKNNLLMLKLEGEKLVVIDSVNYDFDFNDPEWGRRNTFKDFQEKHHLPEELISDFRLLVGTQHTASISWVAPDTDDSAAFTEMWYPTYIKMFWNDCLNIWAPGESYESLEAAIATFESPWDEWEDWRKISTYAFHGWINDKLGRNIIIMRSTFNTSFGRIA